MRRLFDMLCLFLMALAAAPNDLPTLKGEKSSGFEGARSSSGTLVKPFCFTQPTRVCAPAGSWVWFTWSVCGPHANDDCDDQHVTPSLTWLDATAPVEAYGYRWAAVVHRDTTPGEVVPHTLKLDTEVDGQLAAPATISGVALAPGHTRLSHFVRDG